MSLNRSTGSSRRAVYGTMSVIVVACLFLCSACSCAEPSLDEFTQYRARISYSEYLDQYKDTAHPDDEIIVPGVSYVDTDMSVEVIDLTHTDGDSAIPGFHEPYYARAIATEEQGYVEWEVDVPSAGLYNIEVAYMQISGRSTSIEREIRINGAALFGGADTLVLHRVWADEGPFVRDTAGNEIRPKQVERPMVQRVYLSDSLAYESQPYEFFFDEGVNRIRFVSRAEPMAVAYLRLCQADFIKPYDDVSREYEEKGYQVAKDQFIKIQGEDAAYRSSPSLFPVFDQGDPTTEPYHPAQARLNSIGGHRWQIAGDWIAWEVEIKEAGLYQIAIKGKQDQRRGIFSNRKLMIDGKVPFAEVEAVRFNYSPRYQMKRIGVTDSVDGSNTDRRDQPYLFYLDEGIHELKLEVNLGDLAPLIRQTEDTLYELNTIYRSIIMITSARPDPLRTYELEKRIPGLIERLRVQAEIIRSMADEFSRITGQKGGHTATLVDIALMLERMVDRPWVIPNLLGEYRDGIGNLGTWVMNTRNQPLQIDYIIVASPEKTMPRAEPSLFQTMIHEIRAFIASFTHDYTGIRDIGEDISKSARTDPKTLKVWIGMGRDQAQVLKQMIEDSFTPETGIPVVLELVSTMRQLLVPATIAGTAPDIALGAADMNLAFRGAVADLKQFDDFDEIAQRFKRSALVPFGFRDKVFALPEAQSFPMLFYRKDVLAELGLEVPQTWDDVYALIPELKKRHLEFGMSPSMGTYLTFLYQKGVSLYKEDCISANLESEAAIATFEEMTNLFTLHGLPLNYNFINRFRMGEMPLAISNYTDFNTLSIFAPELRGEWGMVPIPGVRQDDGTITRTAPVFQDVLVGDMIPTGTTGSIIMEKSKNKEEAWEFLKWWTRSDTQVRFGREMESLIGAAARYATANVEAMQQLPWKIEEREQLNSQWEWVEGVPPVLGGYYVTRQFDWLFRAVVLNNEPIRESVLEYSREINKEIARKREEFGYEIDIEELDQKWKDMFWDRYTHVQRLDWDSAGASENTYEAFMTSLGMESHI